MLFVTEPKRLILLCGERPPLLRASLLKDRGSVWQEGAHTRGEMRLCVRIVMTVCVREIGSEAGVSQEDRKEAECQRSDKRGK